jgi:insertion element IS1 protein InsB
MRRTKGAGTRSSALTTVGRLGPEPSGQRRQPHCNTEVDARWSCVGNKKAQQWRWHAIDHWSGKVWADVCGHRKDEGFGQVQALLEPCGSTPYHTDYCGVYPCQRAADAHNLGKRHTQKIARQHLTIHMRMKRWPRKTRCFSRSIEMHEIVIGLFVNGYELGLSVYNHYLHIYNMTG